MLSGEPCTCPPLSGAGPEDASLAFEACPSPHFTTSLSPLFTCWPSSLASPPFPLHSEEARQDCNTWVTPSAILTPSFLHRSFHLTLCPLPPGISTMLAPSTLLGNGVLCSSHGRLILPSHRGLCRPLHLLYLLHTISYLTILPPPIIHTPCTYSI
jgi:hypothetical protein